MTPPVPARRERLLGMLLLGIAVVLAMSTPTWFASDQVPVGIAQLLLAVVLAGVGMWLRKRAQRAG